MKKGPLFGAIVRLYIKFYCSVLSQYGLEVVVVM